MTAALAERRFLLVGLGVTNAAVARALVAHGLEVDLVDDGVGEGPAVLADELGRPLHRAPGPDQLAQLVVHADAVVPAPGWLSR